MTTMTTIGDEVVGRTCVVGRFAAPPDVWLALGAERAQCHADNASGVVTWGCGREGDQRRAAALAILEEATAECSSPSHSAHRIFPRALALYRADAPARAQMALAAAVTRLASAIAEPGSVTVRHHADAIAAAIQALADR